jgi:outer membrane lipoprotein-sorting protein
MMIAPWISLVLFLSADAAAFDEFFAEFKEKREHVRVLEAEFRQKTILPDEILTTEGTLLFAQPRRIVIRMNDPERVTLVNHRQGCEYDAEIRQLLIYDMEDNPRADIFFLGFDDDTENLRRAYEVDLFTILDDNRGSKGIRIRPKPEQKEDAYFEEVNLYLRDADYLPYRIHIVNDSESQVFLDVRNIEVNGDIAPERTQIHLPEGVKIIQNDIVRETTGEGGRALPDAIDTRALIRGEKPEETAAAPLVETVPLGAPDTPAEKAAP